VKRRTVGGRVKGHLEIELGLVHHERAGLDGRDERTGFVLNVAEVVNRAIQMREVNVHGLLRLVGAEVDGSRPGGSRR